MKNLLPIILTMIWITSIGCSGDGPTWPGEPDYPAGPFDESVYYQGTGGDTLFDLPPLKGVDCIVNLPEGCPLDPSQLRVQGFMDSDDLGVPNDDLRTIIQTDNLLFLMAWNDTVIGVAYLSPDQLKGGTLEIGVPELADGLIMMNPFMFNLHKSEKRAILEIASTLTNYNKLKFLIATILREEPMNAMNSDMFPHLYKFALDTGYEALTRRYGANFASERIAAGTVGTHDVPHLEDVVGPEIDEVNPKNCFYGVEIENETLDQVHLIGGRPALYVPGETWPPTDLVPPIRNTVTLPEGDSFITFYKGFNMANPQWHDLAAAPGRATYANSIKFIVYIIDTIFAMPMDDDSISDVIDAIGDGEIPDNPDIDFTPIGEIFDMDINTWQKISLVTKELDEQWPELAVFLIENFPEEETDPFLDHAQDAFDAFTMLLENTTDLIQEEEWANERVPFFWDLFNAPGKVAYSVTNMEGELTDNSSVIEPRPAFNFEPPLPKVGDPVTFDASESTDDTTSPDHLLVRWDINADGVYETEWVTGKTFVYNFSKVGPHNVKLDVQDTDGLIASKIQTVYVQPVDAGGKANHIKFFANRDPWDTPSIYEMAEENGSTPGPGPYQYEVCTSSEMDDVELIPGVDLVIIVNDQDQRFYDKLALCLDRFERFVLNGGVILWGACDCGWGKGSMLAAGIEKFPGGVTYTQSYDHYNYNIKPNHPVMKDLGYTLYGNYASHEYFGNLPPNTIIFTEGSTGQPTLIEYKYGFGHIIVSGQPLEHGWRYDYDIGPLLPRLIKYVMGIDPE